MKVKHKFIILFLFLLFLFLFNTDSFGAQYYLPDSYMVIPHDTFIQNCVSWGYITQDIASLPYNFSFYDNEHKEIYFIFSNNPIKSTTYIANNVNNILQFYVMGNSYCLTVKNTYWGIRGELTKHENYVEYTQVNLSSVWPSKYYGNSTANHDLYDITGNILFFSTDNNKWNATMHEEPIPMDEYVLWLDDQNLRKRFQFIFNIPKVREDTKYYVFLDSYTRNSFDSVSAIFMIYTVTTPEGYDYTDYENYMYYDLLDDKLYLPAGCEIQEYRGFGSNGAVVELELIDSFVASRQDIRVYDSSIVSNFINECYLFSPLDISPLEYLLPTNFLPLNSSPVWDFRDFLTKKLSVFGISLSDFFSIVGFDLGRNEEDYVYYELLHYLFYSDFSIYYNCSNNTSKSDLLFSNGDIVCYESVKYDNGRFPKVYDYFRKTKVYSPEVTSVGVLRDNHVRSIANGDDTSSLIPSTYNTDFLVNPLFKNNTNNVSGYFIFNDIMETLQVNKIINYSQPTNYFSNPYNDTFINNFVTNEGDTINNNIVYDNSVIDNSVTNYNYYTIENTKGNEWLSKIYWEVYKIRIKLDDMKMEIDNSVNNFNYNTENTFKHFVVPDKLRMEHVKGKLEKSAKEHLGILYQPWEFVIYTLGVFSEVTDADDIVLNTPELDFHFVGGNTYHILSAQTVNFTELINTNETLTRMYAIYLSAVDFVVLILLCKLAYRIGKETFDK